MNPYIFAGLDKEKREYYRASKLDSDHSETAKKLKRLKIIVSHYFRVNWKLIEGESRQENVVSARYVYMVYAQNIIGVSDSYASKIVNRDRTLTNNAQKRIKNDKDPLHNKFKNFVKFAESRV